MFEPEAPILSYAIDDEDRLFDLSPGFFAFARENEWDHPDSSAGQPIWDYVAGHSMRRLQRSLIERVRDEGRMVRLPFRCDGPRTRRQLDLEVSAPPGAGTVHFSAFLQREEMRPAPQPLLDASTERSAEQVVMCGWCNRFEVDGIWLAVEAAALALGLFTEQEVPAISHGICAHCSELLATR